MDSLGRTGAVTCWAVLVSLWLSTAVSAQPATRGLSAPQLDLSLTLLTDGSVDVRETITFDFREKTFTEVDREISLRRFDDVIDVRASMDGQVRIRRGRTLRVTWKFPKTIDRSRTFTLEYRAMGVLALATGRASLDWYLLPSRHRYPIGQARVTWATPRSAVRIGAPTVEDDRWSLESLPDGWLATRANVGVNETAVLHDTFELASLAVAMPQWQVDADYAEQMAPAFVIGAGTLFVMALGVVGMTMFRYHRPSIELETVIPAPAGSLPPALGTALLAPSPSVGGPQLQATLLDLARRRVLQIQDAHDGKKRKKPTYEIAMHERVPLRPHEEVLTDALWLHMKNGIIGLAAAKPLLLTALPAFRRAVRSELAQDGMVDADRQWAARAMNISSAVVIGLGVAGLVLFRTMFDYLGDLALLLPASVVVAGVMFLIAGQSMSIWSQHGVSNAAAWRARRSLLKEHLRSSWDGKADEMWWPAGVGFGLAGKMLKVSRSAGAGQGVPTWLSHMDDPSAALAMIIVATTMQAGSGGASGGGVSGGGSSGAH